MKPIPLDALEKILSGEVAEVRDLAKPPEMGDTANQPEAKPPKPGSIPLQVLVDSLARTREQRRTKKPSEDAASHVVDLEHFH